MSISSFANLWALTGHVLALAATEQLLKRLTVGRPAVHEALRAGGWPLLTCTCMRVAGSPALWDCVCAPHRPCADPSNQIVLPYIRTPWPRTTLISPGSNRSAGFDFQQPPHLLLLDPDQRHREEAAGHGELPTAVPDSGFEIHLVSCPDDEAPTTQRWDWDDVVDAG